LRTVGPDMPGLSRVLLVAVVVLVCAIALIARLAPYLYPEYEYRVHGKEPPVMPKPAGPVTGRWFDDYYLVEQIDPTTFAVGEPRYYQANYSYLILGEQRAVLFDAGTGTRDIVPVVRSLTTLPVTVIPSHLHFDHVGALGRLDRTALLDVPMLRARVHDSRLTLERYEFMGFLENLKEPTFRVDEWWAPDSSIELGRRSIRVLWTPGHTPTSVSLYDARRHQVFVGDFLYPGHLYAFLPGASRSAYLSTSTRLLATIDPASRIYTAHMAGPPAPVKAPVLQLADLAALEKTLSGLRDGSLETIPAGSLDTVASYPRVFPVRGTLTFATGYPWNDR
jgi:glyoxylase-like metal-dependent hydrolase (beta-lactamase superfamily II)